MKSSAVEGGGRVVIFDSDNDFSKLKIYTVYFNISTANIYIVYFIIGIISKDEIIFDVIDDDCSK